MFFADPPHLGPLPHGRRGWKRFDFDFNHVRAGADAGVHATRGDEFGLGIGICRECGKECDKIFVGKIAGFSAEKAAEKSARESAHLGDIGVAQHALFGNARQCGAEVAHSISMRPLSARPVLVQAEELVFGGAPKTTRESRVLPCKFFLFIMLHIMQLSAWRNYLS